MWLMIQYVIRSLIAAILRACVMWCFFGFWTSHVLIKHVEKDVGESTVLTRGCTSSGETQAHSRKPSCLAAATADAAIDPDEAVESTEFPIHPIEPASQPAFDVSKSEPAANAANATNAAADAISTKHVWESQRLNWWTVDLCRWGCNSIYEAIQ